MKAKKHLKINLKKHFLTLSFVLLIFTSHAATGFLGGDLTWYCIGQDSFIVKMVLYRDCNHDPMVSSISIDVKCKSSGAFIANLPIIKPAPVDITPTCPFHGAYTRCQNPTSTFPYGIEQYTFMKLLVFDNSLTCCDILLSYKACCRSSAFTNIQDGQPFYLEATLNHCLTIPDNSPTFTNPPVAIICRGLDFIFSHGIVDVDLNPNGGLLDSLAYEWSAPLMDHNTGITFNSPFTYEKPLYFKGFPDNSLPFPEGFHLDTYTGDISFHPDSLIFSSLAIRIKEFRDGQLIGEMMRDICIIVMECPINNNPVLAGPYYKETCAYSTVNFSISSNDYDTQDTLRISWNKSIPGAIWSDNNKQVKHPTGTLTWTPDSSDISPIPHVFIVTVRDDACPVSASSTRAYQILVRCPLAIEEPKSSPFKIYPNPAKDYFTVSIFSTENKLLQLDLLDMAGKIIESKTMEVQGTTNLEFGNLSPGLYILKISSDDQISSYKVVLE
ncbi:T9SS type A sorting domain-containing protein [Bacteroidota bacterium]